MTTVEIFWSFRSPYSYLAIGRIIALDTDYDVDLNFRPVRPLALREENFFQNVRPQFVPYLLKDVVREGLRLNMPIALPRPDPVVMDMGTGQVEAEQPYIEQLMSLGLGACHFGRGTEFAQAVSKRIWGGTENWHQGSHLHEAANEAGLELSALEEWVDQNRSQIPSIIEDNESAQLKHHWGVPLMVVDEEEAFFGQDRLDALTWRLDQLKLKK